MIKLVSAMSLRQVLNQVCNNSCRKETGTSLDEIHDTELKDSWGKENLIGPFDFFFFFFTFLDFEKLAVSEVKLRLPKTNI